MVSYSIIKKSQLEGAYRLDAEYYQPEYLELVKNLNNLGAVPMGDVAKNPKRKFKPQEGKIFQYIEISEIDLSTGEYNKKEILGENAPDRAQWIVKQDDVIVSTVRPIRNAVSLIRENIDNLVCSSGFAVLKSENVEPEYLLAYLKSQPIVKLLDRKTTATMYPAITIDDLLNTKIYLGDEKFRSEIKNKIQEAQKELENSESLYSQAEKLLLEELGLKNFEIEDDLSYIVNLSEIKSAHRADAEYFQPKYDKLVQVVAQKFDIQELKQIFSFKRGIFVSTKYYTEEKTNRPYIRIKELSGGKSGIDESKVIFIDERYQEDKNNILKENDLLFSIAGAFGRVAIIPKSVLPANTNQALAIITLKSGIYQKFIFNFLKSDLVLEEIGKLKVGVAQYNISLQQVAKLKIPFPPLEIQKQLVAEMEEQEKIIEANKRLVGIMEQKIAEVLSEV